MTKLSMFLLTCIFWELHAQDSRNLIVLLDWKDERIAEQLDNINLEQEERRMGPITKELATALAQKAAPIITTSSLWHNFVVSRKLVEDFLAGQGLKYKNKYKRFDDATVKQFQEIIQSYFQPSGKNASLHPYQVFLKLSPIEKELYSYFLCYAIPFQENDWIIKKVSDYIYVLIPKEYLEKLKKLDLEKSKELKQVFEELKKTFSKQNRNKQVKELSDDDLYLGLKITAMPTMSYQDALNPEKHPFSIDKNKYAQLLTQKDMQLITKELPRYIMVPESLVLSRHFINVLKNLFVTQQDLTDNENAAKTDLYRALYLHKWYIYLSGHGSRSAPGTLQDIDLRRGFNVFIFDSGLAGMDLFAFRSWLAFLQSNIKTQFLFYQTCYSGGHHLQKLFEHQWEYSAGATLKKEVKPDIFNYMIVAGSLEYSVLYTTPPIISIPYKKISRNEISIEFLVQFPLFFRALKKYFSIDHVKIKQKKIFFETLKKFKEIEAKLMAIFANPASISIADQANINILEKEAKKLLEKLNEDLDFVPLNDVISDVHDIETYRSAVRYPGTDFFVPLPLDTKQEAIERIRYETDAEKKARENEKERIRKVIEQQTKKHIKKQPVSYSKIIQMLRNLQQSLMRLKKAILQR